MASAKRSPLLRIADRSFRMRRRVVLGWLLALFATIAISNAFGGEYQIDFKTPGAESSKAQTLLQTRFPARAGDEIRAVFAVPAGMPSAASEIDAFLAKAKAASPHVLSVASPTAASASRQVSSDGTIAYGVLQLDVDSTDMPNSQTRAIMATAQAASHPGFAVALSGHAINRVESSNGGGGEGIGIIVAAFVLLLTFGSALAMGLPLLIALFGLGIATALIGLIANVVSTPDFAPVVASMIGIGVGIDYVLLIVTRYRAELQRGRDPHDAVVTSIGTAGRAVLFAGCTVIISLMGLFIIGLNFLQGVAISAAAGVLVVMIASITLLPAILGFVGHKIDKWHLPFLARTHEDDKGLWFRWSRVVQRKPWPMALIGFGVIALLCAPIFSIQFGFPDDGNKPTTRTSRQAYDLLAKGFGPGTNAPFYVALELPAGSDVTGDAATKARDAIDATPGVASVSPAIPNPDGSLALLIVTPDTGPQAKATTQLVHRLRDSVAPQVATATGTTVLVGGFTASAIDITDYMTQRLPIFIGTVVFLSFLLLLVVFRSVLVAFKAAVMNVLAIAAAYGIVGFALDGGSFGGLLGIHEQVPLPAFVPMMMFAILFGLSMDYEVFLLSRVREEYLIHGDNGLAVADGLAKTARVITAAAAIMVSVFLSLTIGDDVVLKAIGIGMASAIFVDATIVRMVLVPATMELLGKANWWLPRWLDRLIPNFHIEGASEQDIEAELHDLAAQPEPVFRS